MISIFYKIVFDHNDLAFSKPGLLSNLSI
jgi:hypothetical protein